jgi:ferric-dicitrate binding protein FerR (iron transport regulator)
MEQTRIAYLIQRYLDGTCTLAEKEELADWANQPQQEESLLEELRAAWHQYEPDDALKAFATPAVDRIEQRLFPGRQQPAPVSRLRSIRKWSAIAAAAILLIIAGIAIWKTQQPSQQPPVAVVQDAAPGGHKATLTLGSGQRIVLDTAANGQLALQGTVAISKQANGRIAYAPSAAAASAAVVYNTLSTPRGGHYRLTLPDGTQVWLNAASSITYPVAFTGAQRKVTITGEAYFEVQKDPAHPFIVSKDDVDITVLGTHFNVNAYTDEPDLQVTLLEGAVRVAKPGSQLTLRPGQQAKVTTVVTLNGHPNTEAVMAWKNGTFNFNDKPVATSLRQLSRWYDVDIVYQGPVPNVNIAGEMGMDLNLSQVITVLQKMGVHVNLEGKNLIILP